jgi:hypothetical protein
MLLGGHYAPKLSFFIVVEIQRDKRVFNYFAPFLGASLVMASLL